MPASQSTLIRESILSAVRNLHRPAHRALAEAEQLVHWLWDRRHLRSMSCMAKSVAIAEDLLAPARWRQEWGPVPLRPEITTRNLLYHVYPTPANDGWRANVAKVKPHLGVFNGRTVVAVAAGPGLEPLAAVQEAFADQGIEYLTQPNDPRLREVATFPRLLEAVASTDPHTATFYAHTKGNATLATSEGRMPPEKRLRGATRWRNTMYHALLADWQRAMLSLRLHTFAGTNKITWRPGEFRYPSGLRHGTWMLAGTFFWFRHDRVFGHPAWRDVPDDRYGAEAWPAGQCGPDEAASMYQAWPESGFPPGSPYDPVYYPAEFHE